jgi:flagellar hook-length control protein FliK
VASVAADTSAIAPPPPLPSRSDATPPAGPAGAFSDLLDAASAPPTVPQPQGSSGTRPDDGASAAQASGSSATGASGAHPAGEGAATSAPRNSKNPSSDKGTDDQTGDTNGAVAGSAGVNVTVVAGLALPSFAFAPLPAADQTPAPSPDTQIASSDSVAPTQGDTSRPPADRKDAGASSDPIAAGILAAMPGLVTVVPVAAPDSSGAAQSGPIASPQAATILGAISTASGTDARAAGSDETKDAAPSAQQPDGTGQHNQGASSAALDLLTTVPLPTSAPPATGELQPAALPALVAGNSAAPDQNAQSTPAAPPVITSEAAPGTMNPAAAVAALNPPAPLTPVAAEIQAAAETVGNPGSPRDAGAVQTTLPAQAAVRIAAPAHSTDDPSSDSGTDVLLGFGGASAGATTTPGSGALAGAALAPSFTGILATMQAALGVPLAPQHASVASDAVPLAAVPIAIVTRAEGGERKFEIRLDPPDLGRIEVQLNVDSSGRATSHLVVDRADTLDLLRRDAPVLERALQSAGLTTDSGSLQFSLRDQSFAGRDQGAPAPLAPPAAAVAENDNAPLDTALRRYGAPAGLGGGVDIRV